MKTFRWPPDGYDAWPWWKLAMDGVLYGLTVALAWYADIVQRAQWSLSDLVNWWRSK